MLLLLQISHFKSQTSTNLTCSWLLKSIFCEERSDFYIHERSLQDFSHTQSRQTRVSISVYCQVYSWQTSHIYTLHTHLLSHKISFCIIVHVVFLREKPFRCLSITGGDSLVLCVCVEEPTRKTLCDVLCYRFCSSFGNNNNNNTNNNV